MPSETAEERNMANTRWRHEGLHRTVVFPTPSDEALAEVFGARYGVSPATMREIIEEVRREQE